MNNLEMYGSYFVVVFIIVCTDTQAQLNCLNGGTPSINQVGQDVCQCPIYYTGINCEKAVCVLCHEEIYKSIFAGYSSHVIPDVFGGNGTDVDVDFTIINLIDIIEKDEQMKVMGFFTLYWVDPRLVWNPDDYGGVNKIAVPAQDVWLPDVIMSNSAVSFYDYSFKRDFLVEINSNGLTQWEFGGNFLTSCDIDMTKYPFDTQSCSVNIETWRYQVDTLRLFAHGIFTLPAVKGNSLWNLGKNEVIEKLIYNNRFTRLLFTFNWERKPLYYHMNIIIPALMMVFASLGVYWLPCVSGEKVSLAVTLLLAFSVFLIIIMDNTPTSSTNVPLITRFVILVMAVTTLSLLVSIIVAYINGKQHHRRVAKLIRSVFLGFFARIMCMHVEKKDIGVKIQEKVIDQEEFNDNVKENSNNVYIQRIHFEQNISDSDIIKKLNDILKILSEEEKKQEIKEEWVKLGLVIDRLFFWISFFVLLIMFPMIFLHIT